MTPCPYLIDVARNPPAPLEDIIDGAVKTGADLSGVVAWNYENSRQILEARIPVPTLLHHRLSVDYAEKENRPPLPLASKGHWLDRLEQGVQEHIREMILQRDELVARAMPPEALFECVVGEAEVMALGARLNQTYAWALKRAAATRELQGGKRLEATQRAVEEYLTHFRPAQRGKILRAALVSAYQAEKPVSDAAVWLSSKNNERDSTQPGIGQSSIASLTITALREIDLLDDIIATKEGLIVYPAMLNAESQSP